MSDLNKFCFTGRLTADSSIRTLASGKSVLTAPVAINTGYGDYKKTLFIKIQMWGDRGAKVQPFLKKGTLIASDGELSRNDWNTNEGKQMVDFVVDIMQVSILAQKKSDAPVPNEPVEDDYSDVVF